MEVDLKGNIIKRGLLNLRRQKFEDLSHRRIEENLPKTRALTLAAMFDSLALQQQQKQCLQPARKIRTVVTESPKTSNYGKLSIGNPVSVKVQSGFRPYTNCSRILNSAKVPSGGTSTTVSSGIKSNSAFKEVSLCNQKLKRTPHFKEQKQLNHAVTQPLRVTGQTKLDTANPSSWTNKSTFSAVSNQQFIKLPRAQMASPSNKMKENVPKLPGVMAAEIEKKYSKHVNFDQRLHFRSAELKSMVNSSPINTWEEKPVAVRSSFLTFTTPVFHSTSFPVQPVKCYVSPITIAKGTYQEECSKFAEITKYSIINFDRNSLSLEMKQRITTKESLRWFPSESEVEADEDLTYGRLNNPSHENREKLSRTWNNFEMKDRDSALETKPLELAKRKPLRHTNSFPGRKPLAEKYRKNSIIMNACSRMASITTKSNSFDTVSSSESEVNFRNSECCASAENFSRHTTVECNQNYEDEVDLHSISVELRKKTETAFRYSNWDSHHRKCKGEQKGSGTFVPQISRRRVGVYGTISSSYREYTSSEDSERDDLSSDESVSSPESQSSFTNETLSSDSGLCEDIEGSESKWQISYTLSKLRNSNLCRSHHQLWCQIPEIFNSELFRKLTLAERKLQEAKFEVITSEISYAKSLNILISHFLENLKNIISDEDNKTIFANIISVKCSTEKFLIDLEKCWRKDASLQGIGEIIQKHAKENFRVYVTYCRNQIHQANLLNHLMKSDEFCEAIQDLESDPICQKLTLNCFLILPMQRVTRIRLLVKTILETLPADDPKYKGWRQTLNAMDRLVQDCNDAASNEILYEEMSVISKQLDFSLVGEIGLLRRGRHLVKKGELFHLYCSGCPQNLQINSIDSRTINAFCLPGFGRRIIKQSIHLFLFTDLMVIAKKKSDENFTVIDYCPREFIDILTGDPGILQELLQRNFSDYKNVLHLFIRKNCQNRKAEMILFAPGEAEKKLWIKAFETYSSVELDIYRE